ncbi:MAG: hypothetical protein J5620_02545 [Alphaproteobacteria bacterium]|nr:hypothetical protein [Alphaproteobacteria bacterium]
MSSQKDAQPQVKLDSYSKIKLGNAYMSLYEALVAEGQAQNMSLGTSWYNALFKISDILKSDQSNVALDYLKRFFMSHRKGEIKKMMTAKERFNTIESNPAIVTAASDKVKQETQNLQNAIQSVIGGEVLIVCKPIDKPVGKNFYNWVENQPEDIVVDFSKPRSFEKAYKKYILQQKGK